MESQFKATKDCEFISDNGDGSQTWRGMVVTGKGDTKQEVPCDFLVWLDLAKAVEKNSEFAVLDDYNRQGKTDKYNSVRNGLNATPTPRGAVNRALKALQSGDLTAEQAKAIFDAAIASMAAGDSEEPEVA